MESSPIPSAQVDDTSFKVNEFQDIVKLAKEEKPCEDMFNDIENSPQI